MSIPKVTTTEFSLFFPVFYLSSWLYCCKYGGFVFIDCEFFFTSFLEYKIEKQCKKKQKMEVE